MITLGKCFFRFYFTFAEPNGDGWRFLEEEAEKKIVGPTATAETVGVEAVTK